VQTYTEKKMNIVSKRTLFSLGRLFSTEAAVSRLSNGVRIAALPSQGAAVSRVGVVIGGGSRHEPHNNSGVSLFFPHVAFQGNATSKLVSSHLKILENNGVQNFSVSRDRENITYAASVLPEKAEDTLDVLAGIVSNPKLEEHHVHEVLETIHRISKNVSGADILQDCLHRDAFRGQPLSRALFPTWNVEHNEFTHIEEFRQKALQNSIIVVGVGIDRKILEAVAQRAFGDKTVKPEKPASKYVGGGESRVPGDLSNTRVILAFEGEPITNIKSYLSLSAFAKLLGSFHKKAKPGSGSTSRLSQFGQDNKWVKGIDTFNIGYSDTGLFGIDATGAGGQSNNLTGLLLKELKTASSSLNESDVKRAKNQLTLSFYDWLDSNSGRFCYAAKFSPSFDSLQSSEAVVQLIQSLTVNDLQNAANKALSSKPSVAALGDVDNLAKL